MVGRQRSRERSEASEISDWDGKQDAFFKKMFLKSPVLMNFISRKLGLSSEDLRDLEAQPSEFQSRAVSDAFHGKKPWKELRSDGYTCPPVDMPLASSSSRPRIEEC